MPQKPVTKPQLTQSHGRIRAFRHSDVESQLERSRMLLGLSDQIAIVDPSRPQRLARALRLARRAARAGFHDYDPVRHLVLARYLRALGLPGPGNCGDIRKNRKHPREDV
jgi:hypothetical protein